MKKPVGVLFVCLGNICRSPAAEGVFIDRVKKMGLSDCFRIDSCGTGRWHIGKPADSRMIAAAMKRDIHLPSICRQIETGDFTEFEYIIPMDQDNLKNVTELAPKSATASIIPMWTMVTNRKVDKIPDPYFGGEEGFEEVLDLLENACENLLKTICRKEGIPCQEH
jgi:protein-tyrosine phosphatase